MSVDCFKMSVTRLNYSAMTGEQEEPILRVTFTEGFVREDSCPMTFRWRLAV